MTYVATLLLGLLLAAPAASAQSLGEIARKEEARRKAVQSGKVYTNDSIKPEPGGASPAPASAAPPAAAPPSVAGAQGSRPDEKPAEDPKKTEQYWRDRVAAARNGLQRAKMFEEALQSRINALSADFAARDDPAQRSVVATDRQKALAELERVKKEIADFEQQLRDIEEEARKAGVPPGWLR